MKRRSIAMACALLVLGGGIDAGQAAREEFRVDMASSTMVVHVERAGLLAFAGHDHEVTVPVVDGSVLLDRTDPSRSIVRLQFDAMGMKVTGKGEPPDDVPEVQRVMLSDRVLDAQRNATIAFASRSIGLVKRSPDQMLLSVEGLLTLRGVTRPVTVPVDVRLSADRLTVRGKATVRQTLFGIRPVTAAAGTIRVKDEVEVVFDIVARRP
jgi:polyisoprenoid-binding protein YceI